MQPTLANDAASFFKEAGKNLSESRITMLERNELEILSHVFDLSL